MSSEILREVREFERASTAAVNAYVQPKMSRYLTALEQAIGERQLRVMQSDGGVASARLASRQPVRTILSGPAGGVNGALMMAKMAGMHRVLSFDMGGTSTDVSLCDGEPTITYEGRVGPHPVRLPMLDIHTVGAGGGSIAYLDLGGALRVGPRSAGAEPGPVCYARGGREPTVTDANLICGRMLADRFLGGRIRLDAAAAERALSGLATQAGLEALALAEGVLEVANVLMARALRVISVERGFDPREFALIAFGGAGGMHACALAEALEMRRILVPAHAGVLSALGMISADLTRRYVQMWLRPLDEVDHDALCGAFEALEARARDEMTDEGVANERLTLRRFVDLRYEGQSYELTLPLDDPRRASLHDSLRSRFGEAHEQRYGYRHEERPIELVALRLRAIGRVDKPQLAAAAASHAAMPERPHRIWLRGAWCDAVAVSRDALRVGGRLHGPALIADDHATTLLHPGWVALKDRFGSLLLNRKG